MNDLLIALSARTLGAAVTTMDSDFRAIAGVVSFDLELLTPE